MAFPITRFAALVGATFTAALVAIAAILSQSPETPKPRKDRGNSDSTPKK